MYGSIRPKVFDLHAQPLLRCRTTRLDSSITQQDASYRLSSDGLTPIESGS
jgi:hypothetical protein